MSGVGGWQWEVGSGRSGVGSQSRRLRVTGRKSEGGSGTYSSE
jgi:hypothetical protein